MAFLVIALGALLSLCGALAIGWGYPIIQVERGWAGVIAGSTALSCGFVTLALGLILHRLSSLHALLRNGRSITPPVHEAGDAEASELPQEPGLSLGSRAAAPAVAPLVPGSRPWAQRPPRFGLGSARSSLKPRAPAARLRESGQEAPPKPLSPLSDQLDGPVPAEQESLYSAALPGAAGGAAGGEPSSEEWLSWEDEKEKEQLLGQSLPETALTPGAPEEKRQDVDLGRHIDDAAIEAILREELRIEPVLSREARAESTEPSPEPIEPAGLNPPSPASSAEEADHPQPLTHEPEPPDIPATSGERLTIVGRHESEGTSYIMYSDGSIEARTENAVFHFKSMSELKSFMESQAQGPRD